MVASGRHQWTWQTTTKTQFYPVAAATRTVIQVSCNHSDGSKSGILIWDPHLGSFIWDPHLGSSSGILIWDPHLGSSPGILIWDPHLGSSIWDLSSGII